MGVFFFARYGHSFDIFSAEFRLFSGRFSVSAFFRTEQGGNAARNISAEISAVFRFRRFRFRRNLQSSDNLTGVGEKDIGIDLSAELTGNRAESGHTASRKRPRSALLTSKKPNGK